MALWAFLSIQYATATFIVVDISSDFSCWLEPILGHPYGSSLGLLQGPVCWSAYCVGLHLDSEGGVYFGTSFPMLILSMMLLSEIAIYWREKMLYVDKGLDW